MSHEPDLQMLQSLGISRAEERVSYILFAQCRLARHLEEQLDSAQDAIAAYSGTPGACVYEYILK